MHRSVHLCWCLHVHHFLSQHEQCCAYQDFLAPLLFLPDIFNSKWVALRAYALNSRTCVCCDRLRSGEDFHVQTQRQHQRGHRKSSMQHRASRTKYSPSHSSSSPTHMPRMYEEADNTTADSSQAFMMTRDMGMCIDSRPALNASNIIRVRLQYVVTIPVNHVQRGWTEYVLLRCFGKFKLHVHLIWVLFLIFVHVCYVHVFSILRRMFRTCSHSALSPLLPQGVWTTSWCRLWHEYKP